MNTHFFSQIQQLEFTGVLQLNISKGAENNLIVTVLLNNEQCGDSAKNGIPPLTFNATPQEFDEGFFQQITAPLQRVSGLMVDMDKFLQQLEEVKMQSAMEKDKAEKEKKAQDTKEKKYRDAMAKADELEKEGKYRDAWIAVPEPSLFPERAEELRKRRASLSTKFAPDLFCEATEEPQKEQKTVTPPADPDALYPSYQVDVVEEEMDFDEVQTEY